MIKVYVFITGLVLYQFTSTPGGTSYAILGSGHFALGDIHIGDHTIKIQYGDKTKEQSFSHTLEAELTVSCPQAGCTAIKSPELIPSLKDLTSNPTIQPECLNFASAKCHPYHQPTASGRNGLLAFTGDWTVEALTDCGGSTYPDEPTPTVEMNFVRAGRSWELLHTDLGKLPKVVNTVLFTTQINTMSDLKISNMPDRTQNLDAAQGDLTSFLAPIANCKKLRGFENSGATQCAVVLIRNGSNDPYLGGGDLHYAALYELLEHPPAFNDFWLPIASTVNVCGGGGGTGGQSHCTGMKVTLP